MEKGYFHIYCGDGKGKTSILNGMALRALGSNMSVKYVRFLKNIESSEDKVLKKINLEIENFYHFSNKFIWEMNEQEITKFREETLNGFSVLKKYLQDPCIDLILVDELLGAVENKFIDLEELIYVIKNRNPKIEIAISGRKSYQDLDELADLISVVQDKKHYFKKGLKSRKGIEF